MKTLRKAATYLKFLMHRALILNEITAASREHPLPLFIYNDERLLPKRLLRKGAGCETARSEDTDHIHASISPDRPTIVAIIEGNPIDHGTAQKIAATPYLLYLAGRSKGHHFPDNVHASKRLAYSLASNYKDVSVSLHPYLMILLMALLFTLLGTSGQFLPPDDYARHAKAYQYGYNYRNLYPLSNHATYDTYLLFDFMASNLHMLLGANAATVFQVLPMVATLLAAVKLCKPSSQNMTNIILIAILFFTWQRFQSARPCVLMSSAFLLLYAHRENMGRAAHYIAGTIMAATYYIFFIYTIPFLLTKKTRLPYLAATVTGLAFWSIYSSGNYIPDLISLASTQAHLQKYGIEYAELKPIFGAAMLSNLAPLLPLALYYRKDPRQSLAAAFFLLLNQVRYLETAIPLAITMLSKSTLRMNMIAVLAAMTIFLRTLTPISYQPISLPANSNILTYSSTLMNMVVAGSDNITVSPSPNIDWDAKDVAQAIVNTVKTGSFDCGMLDRHNFDYVVENNFTSTPQCLRLHGTTPQARIWVPANSPLAQKGNIVK